MSKNKKKKAWAENGLEDWGAYMAAKKEKLEDQFQEAAEKEFQDASNLFSGMAIFVNGYTSPCADELKRLMMEHGGIYHHYMRTGITTHIIASNLPYSKIVAYRKSKNPLPIVKPEWITDSIAAGKLLDWRPYILYSNCTVTQPKLAFPGIKSNVENSPPSQRFVDNCQETRATPLDSGEPPGPKKSSNHENNAPLSTKNPEFLSEFYNNSRLHHISTMGMTFKDYVNDLRARSDGNFPGLTLLKVHREKKSMSANYPDSDSDSDLFENSPRVRSEGVSKMDLSRNSIMHIDMDCFFVSVGLRNRPELRGLPVAVAHARGNTQKSANSSEDDFGSMSEVASCSYEARKCGVKNGMFLGQALKLCRNLKTIQYDFEAYKQVSYALYDTVASYTLEIEAVSCDEMYADITSVIDQSGLTSLEFASIIRDEIKNKTGCPVSTGFGCNKLQARLATRKAKPDGQFSLESSRFRDIIGPMPVRDLPGVGYSTTQLLNKMNVRTCSELHDISLGQLQKEFGKKTGEMLYNLCRGIDASKVSTEHVRKSVSAEVNYGIRFDSGEEAENFLVKLSEEVCNRLQKANSKARTVTLKLMIRAKDAPKEAPKFMGHGACDNLTKTKNLIAPIDDPVIIIREVISLWKLMQQPFEDVRGIGIQMGRLESSKAKTGSIMDFMGKAKEKLPAKNTERPCPSDEIVAGSEKTSSIRDFVGKGNRGGEKKKDTEKKEPRREGGLAGFLVKKSVIIPNNGSKFVAQRTMMNDFLGSSELPGQDIDEAILAELPEEIRREITESRSAKIQKTSLENRPKIINDSSNSSADREKDCRKREQMYDQSVFNELPKDIQKEILGKSPTVPRSLRQTSQEDYFKHEKSGTRRPKMPPIEEIDMSVLIELPDDIRNEIINDYKSRKEEKNGKSAIEENTEKKESKKFQAEKLDDQNNLDVSFSQVDPDFLAALSDDMRTEVEMYCRTMKKQRKPTTTESAATKLTTKKLTERKSAPKNGSKSISLNKRGKNKKMPGKTVERKESSTEESRINDGLGVQKWNGSENGKSSGDRRVTRFMQDQLRTDDPYDAKDCSQEQRQQIISHHSSFNFESAANSKERDLLTNLVNYLFTLPVRQIKTQIETWISNSNDVNEIDLLSLATFLSMLPKKKRLEDLHIFLKTMHRYITKTGSCVWHETYRRTVDHVQRYMQIEYNSKMLLPTIDCKRDCKAKEYL